MENRKYKLSIGAIFKNEEHCILEWIEHYLHHGVEHFYLIDDSSNDNSVENCRPYIEKGMITLFNHENQWDYYLGRQRDMYNHYILPHIKNTQWLIMVDLDEFLWSPIQINICELLMNQCMHLGQIQVRCIHFASSGFIEQPKNIVGNFLMTSKCHDFRFLKYIINCNFEFSNLNVHSASFSNKDYENEKYFIIVNDDYLVFNHYSIQSLDFWIKIKCTRGDSDNYKIRTIDDFYLYDKNDVEDKRLYEQNKEILDNL